MINIYVQRTLAKACSDAPITSGSVGLTAQFLFSEEWNELTKKAIFETDNYKEPVDVPESGEVVVPDSVLVYPWTQLRVGVRGESEDGYVVIPTVYADCGTIRLGANTTPVGPPPTPSQAEHLQAQIDELRESGIGGGPTIELDPTLTQSGKAADAKAVGDALENVGGKAYVQDTEPAQMEVGEFWYNPDEAGSGEIPTTLPNPHKLTFSGAVNAEYDGSEAVEVVIPQGGGGGEEVWEDICDITIGADVYAQHILTAAEGKKYKKLEVCIANNQTKKARIVLSSSGEYGPPPDSYQSTNNSIAYAINWTPTNTYGRCEMRPIADTFFECSFFCNAGAATSWDASNTKTYEPVWSDDSLTNASENKWRRCYRGGGIDQISIYSTDTATPITSGCRVIIKGVRF